MREWAQGNGRGCGQGGERDKQHQIRPSADEGAFKGILTSITRGKKGWVGLPGWELTTYELGTAPGQ